MKVNLSALMIAAWRIVKVYGFTMSEALKKAWMQFKLKALMAVKTVVKFEFMKLNGERRVAYGTLKDIPETKGTRKACPGVQTYFDVEVDDWRSYHIERLIAIA